MELQGRRQKTPLLPKPGEVGHPRYGVTVTVTVLEVTVVLPLWYVAVSAVVPVCCCVDSTHIGVTPLNTSTRVEGFVCQVTLVVTSTPPGFAMAIAQLLPVAVVFSVKVMLVGWIVMLVMFAKVTVAVAVPVAVPDAAVMVVVPAETPVKVPPVLIVATLGVELDQHTVSPVQLVPPESVTGASPWLSCPSAVSGVDCPMLTVGLGGSIVTLVMVGFTKNPLQLTASASVPSTANAPMVRRFHFIPDIFLGAFPCPIFASNSVFSMVSKNCSRDEFAPAHS